MRSAFMQAPTRNGRPEYMKELNLLIVLEAFRVRGRRPVARSRVRSPAHRRRDPGRARSGGRRMTDGGGKR